MLFESKINSIRIDFNLSCSGAKGGRWDELCSLNHCLEASIAVFTTCWPLCKQLRIHPLSGTQCLGHQKIEWGHSFIDLISQAVRGLFAGALNTLNHHSHANIAVSRALWPDFVSNYSKTKYTWIKKTYRIYQKTCCRKLDQLQVSSINRWKNLRAEGPLESTSCQFPVLLRISHPPARQNCRKGVLGRVPPQL